MDHALGNTIPKFSVSQEGLKLLACLTMLIDHIGALFFPHRRKAG